MFKLSLILLFVIVNQALAAMNLYSSLIQSTLTPTLNAVVCTNGTSSS